MSNYPEVTLEKVLVAITQLERIKDDLHNNSQYYKEMQMKSAIDYVVYIKNMIEAEKMEVKTSKYNKVKERWPE